MTTTSKIEEKELITITTMFIDNTMIMAKAYLITTRNSVYQLVVPMEFRVRVGESITVPDSWLCKM